MDDFDDFPGESQNLTFVDTDDDGMPIATQDSQFDYGNQFSLPTQASQANSESELVSGVESVGDLTFQDVDDDDEGSDDTLDNKKYIEHACKYCGISDPLCVAKCTVCSKWFCNAKTGTAASHIVNHMVKSLHREAYLHKDSPCGDTQLECYICGCKNVFNLGFIPAKTDAAVVILCRQPCAAAASAKNPDWIAEDWKTLISERQLLSWIVNIPSEEQVMRSRKITNTQANRLEEVWVSLPDATLEDLNKPGIDRDPDPVLLRYQDAYHYKRVFKPLINFEADYDKKMKESQTQMVGTVRWEQGLKKTHLAFFHLPKFSDGCMKLMVGDELRLKHNQTVDGSEWKCIGSVFKIPDNHSDEIGIEIRQPVDKSVTESRIMFTCEVVWNSTTFERQFLALEALLNDNKSVSQYIYQKIMGLQVDEVMLKLALPKRFSVPNLPDLNSSQMQAVKQVLTRPLSLIQGPPGTGKTVVSATIVYHLVKQTEGQVLVCSPSNIAVDHLAEKIHLTGLKVVRICAKSREGLESTVEFLTLHSQLKTLGGAELKKLLQLKEEIGELEDKDHVRFMQLKRVKEHDILANADVICCTCSSAADSRLKKIRIRTVLIDESTQATEPEVLVSIVRGVRQLVLVGDHQQLGPVVTCKRAANAGLNQSLFERLVLLGHRPHRLQVQYRMHPVLSAFPSNAFYEGTLQNGVNENERKMAGIDWHWPTPDKPTFFWSCYGAEELSASGTSFLNRTEAANVEKLVSKLIRGGVMPEQIGVITPYEGQRSFIVNYMHTQGTLNTKLYENVQIANVDAFQGREKDYIVVTCVRSNDASGIGFLSDPRRLNVAITRAKYGMVIVGNTKVLSRHELWHDLISHYKDKGLVYEGPINNLKQVNITIPRATVKAKSSLVNNRYGVQRMNYTMNEYRGNGSGSTGASANMRYPPTYASSQSIMGLSRSARQANSSMPVPLSVINPQMYAAKNTYRDRRNQDSRFDDFSQDGASQSQFAMSQGTQDHPGMRPPSSHHIGGYEASLSGWSQSQQSQIGSSRFTGHTQPMSQDMDDMEREMAGLLMSQNG